MVSVSAKKVLKKISCLCTFKPTLVVAASNFTNFRRTQLKTHPVEATPLWRRTQMGVVTTPSRCGRTYSCAAPTCRRTQLSMYPAKVPAEYFTLFAWPWAYCEVCLADIQRRGSLAWIVILSVYGTGTIAIDLSLSALISWLMKSIIGFLNNSNLHAIISTLLIINLQWVYKIYSAAMKKYTTMLFLIWSAVFSLLQSFNYTPYLLYKKRFKSQINSFCIWTQASPTPNVANR